NQVTIQRPSLRRRRRDVGHLGVPLMVRFGRQRGPLCCSGQHCKPVEATVLPNGSYYLPASGEIIPADMATPSPDDRFHHCIYYPVATDYAPWGYPVREDKPKTRCFFAPMNSS